MVSAGLHWSFRMSKQMALRGDYCQMGQPTQLLHDLHIISSHFFMRFEQGTHPLLLMLGWYTFVLNITFGGLNG